MDDIIYLGSGKNFAEANNFLTSKIMRLTNGDQYLFNCGEGTQTRMKESHARPGKIRKIFISELRNDTISGLPGLMCSLGPVLKKDVEGECPAVVVVGVVKWNFRCYLLISLVNLFLLISRWLV